MELQTLPDCLFHMVHPCLHDPEQVGPALHRLSVNLPTPKAIIVMSAHWESKALEVSSSTRPKHGMTSVVSRQSCMKFAILPRSTRACRRNFEVVSRCSFCRTCQ